MTDFFAKLDELIYNIPSALDTHLRCLVEDLEHLGDEKAIERTDADIDEILRWLGKGPQPDSPEEKLERIRKVLDNEVLPAEERVKAIVHIGSSTGRRRGRPRDDTAKYAIQALTLKHTTGKSWSEIALEVKGCTHPHPKGKACEKCKESIRIAALRLKNAMVRMEIPPFHRN